MSNPKWTREVAIIPPAEEWPGSSMLEAAMGLISNAKDWDDSPNGEWCVAARRWLDAYWPSKEEPAEEVGDE